jgi:hypothetical protein
MNRNGKSDELVLHGQTDEEIAIVGAASIKNQHGGAGMVRSLPLPGVSLNFDDKTRFLTYCR